jgi:DNA-binding Lrp family transcriptional regulator
MTQASPATPLNLDDPVNAAILSVSEDQLEGFHVDPFGEIARRSRVDPDVVIERIRALLEAGTIRRVRQTLLSNNLAEGALVAWQIPNERLQEAFDYLFQHDPFSGHVVIRTTDSVTPGSSYRLWTTLKVPQGYSIEKHCDHLKQQIGAEAYLVMQAKALFVLGVGHTRRKGMEPGEP